MNELLSLQIVVKLYDLLVAYWGLGVDLHA